jgi:hypothetical protein
VVVVVVMMMMTIIISISVTTKLDERIVRRQKDQSLGNGKAKVL